MKHLMIALAAILALAFVANAQVVVTDGPVVVANDPAAAPAKKELPKPIPLLEQTKSEMDKAVQLSDDQKKAIDDIIATAEKSKQELADAFKPIKEAYDKAVKDKDDDATNKAVEDWRAMYKRQADVNNRAIKDMVNTLSAEKLDKWYDYKLASFLKQFTGMNLTKEQTEKIKQEYIKLSKDDALKSWIMRNKLFHYVYKEVITADQKTDQIMTNIPKMYANLDLTKEQLEKIRQECSKLNNDSSVEFGMVSIKLSQYVQNEVLTEAQKAAMEKMYKAFTQPK